MHLIFAASESAPWVKSGGLGEVMGALPVELARLGHRITLYLPLYRTISRSLADRPADAELLVPIQSLTIPFPGFNRFVRVLDGGQQRGVQVYFIDCPAMFDRDGIYGSSLAQYPDNAERFGLYCRAVIESAKLLGIPDIFHAHDWQAALLPVFLQTLYAEDTMLSGCGSVFTIHNAGYQGQFPPEILQRLLLPSHLFDANGLEAHGSVNLFKGGLLYADALTTVSKHYAEELMTPEYGAGLDGVFRKRKDSLTGIMNGVDYAEWDPSRDSHIAAHFSAEDLRGKHECRRDLLHAFSADNIRDTTPVIGVVARLTSQKGFDLLAEVFTDLMQDDLMLLVLGSGEELYERLFLSLAEKYPKKLRVQTQFDNTMSHKIHAGSDISLMPSRYEPSGLSQLYSLRYGTIPVVRATGGLEDTVHEGPEGEGFRFEEYKPEELLHAVRRATKAFPAKDSWQAMMRRGMQKDYSWEKPAKEYVQVYERVLEMRAQDG